MEDGKPPGRLVEWTILLPEKNSHRREGKEYTMTAKKLLTLLITSIPALLSLGCHYGKVEQGQAIAYDKQRGPVTII
jgi:hypothetical protein